MTEVFKRMCDAKPAALDVARATAPAGMDETDDARAQVVAI